MDLVQATDRQAVFEDALDGVIATNEAGVITAWNRSAEEIFGWTARDAVGRGLSETVVPSHLGRDGGAALNWPLAGREESQREVVAARAVHRDGHQIEIELTTSRPIDFGKDLEVIVFVRDVTWRRRAQRLQAAQLAAGRALAVAATPEDACREVLREIGESLELTLGRLLVWNDGAMAISRTWIADREGEGGERLSASDADSLRFPPGQGPASRTWETREPQWILPADRLPWPSGFAFPVLNGEQMVGVMEFFDSRHAPGPDAATLESMADLGRRLGELIGRREAEAELREIFEFSPIGLARSALDGSMLTGNRALAELLGRPVDQIAGVQIRDVTVPEDVEETDALYREMRSGRRDSVMFEKRYIRPDGRIFWGHLIASAVKDPGGRPRYFISTVQDIEDRKRAEAMQRHAMAELERVNRLKTDFVGVVSHEFRTTLMSIQGFSELVRDLELTPAEVQGYATRINTEARRLARLVNDMLDLNRIESGRLALSLESIDVNQMVRDAVEEMGVISDNHSFTVALDPAVGTVEADRDRLMQVVTNLLSNTVKYSPRGGEVSVRTQLRDSLVHVSVSDQGIGIPEASLERVFERFSRIAHPDTNKVAGTGLGLAIVKEIVELHGGHVWAESQLGKGTTFHFTMPQAGAPGALAARTGRTPKPDMQRGTSDGC